MTAILERGATVTVNPQPCRQQKIFIFLENHLDIEVTSVMHSMEQEFLRLHAV